MALAALTAYLVAPASAQPSMSVAYSATGSTLSGVVKSPSGKPLRNALVVVRVRNASESLLLLVRLHTNRRGLFNVHLPKGTTHLRVVVRGDHGRAVNKVFWPKPGQSLQVTAVFPPLHAGLIPGLFPY